MVGYLDGDKYTDKPLNTSQWLDKYERFLLKNAGQISSIESTLRSLTFIVPGRFQDVEIVSEGLYSILQILGLYHDSILAKAARQIAQTDPTFRISNHNRYTRYFLKHGAYKAISLGLTLTRYSEILVEMIAKKNGGQRGRWRAIIAVEFFKATLRLTLLAATQNRPILSPPIPERDLDPNLIHVDEFGDLRLGESDAASIKQLATSWRMPRLGKGIPETPIQDIPEFLTSKALRPEDVCSPEGLLHQLNGKGLLAEVIYVLRPLIYAVLAYEFRNRSESSGAGTSRASRLSSNWTPWVIGIAIEVLARRLSIKAYKESLPGGFRSLTKLENEELKRRGMALWWWLLRGAMYENFTRPLLERVINGLTIVPIIKIFAAIFEDYLYLFDEYFFSSSTL